MLELNHLVGRRLQLFPTGRTRTAIDVILMDTLGTNTWLVSLSREDVCSDYIEANRDYTIQATDGNVVYLLRVIVKKIAQYPFPHLHIYLREDIKNHTRRKQTRYPVRNSNLSLNVISNKKEQEICMIDISCDGAQLVSTNRLGKIDDLFVISVAAARNDDGFVFPCQLRYVLTEIDPVSRDKFIFRHGVEFSDLTCESENFLEKLLTESQISTMDFQ